MIDIVILLARGQCSQAQVKLPILVEAAAAEAKLSRISCGSAPSATLAVRPGVARARIGTVDESKLKNFKTALTSSPATVASALGLATVKAHADLEIADLERIPLGTVMSRLHRARRQLRAALQSDADPCAA